MTDEIGVREIRDLFKEFIRKEGWPCEGCPERFDCHADIGCFHQVVTDFTYWLKQRLRT